ncbi:MAG TPA: aminotransferase class I/II-fold pyridoxal phosphate-dependent enzyme, partial [Bacillota bacterium]|nr:aminotransferase class I/II-fold pyridoxal phosphate-dependent enzyme [Bacillota bacterium]
MKTDTLLARAGLGKDPQTGAISMPVYQTATFSHPALGVSTGYDYSRTVNPTRLALEEVMAKLEKGERGLAFASGMAALTSVLMLFSSGDHLIVSDDLYGGTYRLLEKVFRQFGLTVSYVDTANQATVEQARIPGKTKGVLIETPTNPLMKITDIAVIAAWARSNQLLTIVDNTFMTPYLQRPLELGADLVVHSGTKYLGGHNDVLSGVVVAANRELGDRVQFIQNSTGAVLGPQDSWLMLRGLKTLAVRLERQTTNAIQLAEWLLKYPKVSAVFYPGLSSHPGYQVHQRQAQGPGAMLSFRLKDAGLIEQVINRLEVIT